MPSLPIPRSCSSTALHSALHHFSEDSSAPRRRPQQYGSPSQRRRGAQGVRAPTVPWSPGPRPRQRRRVQRPPVQGPTSGACPAPAVRSARPVSSVWCPTSGVRMAGGLTAEPSLSPSAVGAAHRNTVRRPQRRRGARMSGCPPCLVRRPVRVFRQRLRFPRLPRPVSAHPVSGVRCVYPASARPVSGVRLSSVRCPPVQCPVRASGICASGSVSTFSVPVSSWSAAVGRRPHGWDGPGVGVVTCRLNDWLVICPSRSLVLGAGTGPASQRRRRLGLSRRQGKGKWLAVGRSTGGGRPG
jgi:hypothetical protein